MNVLSAQFMIWKHTIILSIILFTHVFDISKAFVLALTRMTQIAIAIATLTSVSGSGPRKLSMLYIYMWHSLRQSSVNAFYAMIIFIGFFPFICEIFGAS